MVHVTTAPAVDGVSQAVTVVVPCFNEKRRLDAAAFIAFAARFPHVRFLFVDDGSTDGTLAMLRSLCHGNAAAFSVLAFPQNRGKAEAVRTGLLHALLSHPAYVAFWDADLATPLEELLALLRLAESHRKTHMVVGSRVRLLGRSIERSTARHYLGRVFATVASLVLRLPLYDTQCGAKLLRVTPELPSLLHRPFLSRWVFDVELLARIAENATRGGLEPQVSIVEHPLHVWRERGGTSIRIRDAARIPWDLLRIAWMIRKERRRGREQRSTPEDSVAAGNE